MTETVHFETTVSPTGVTYYTGPFVHAALAPRQQAHLLGSDWDTYGVYILLGYPGRDGVTNAYAGQSTELVTRMTRPDHKAKEFWTRALMIQSPLRAPFNRADIGFLEGRLIEVLRTSAELRLTNRLSSSDESVSLTRRQYLEEHVLPTVLAILSQQVPGLTFGTRVAQHTADHAASTASAEPLEAALAEALDRPVPVPTEQAALPVLAAAPTVPLSIVPAYAKTGRRITTTASDDGRPSAPRTAWDSSALWRAQRSHRFLNVPDMLAERGNGLNGSYTDRLTGPEILVYLDRLHRADPETGLAPSEIMGSAARTGLHPDEVCDADERLITAGLLTARLPRDRSQPALLDATPARRVVTIPVPAIAIWPSTAPDAPARWTGEDASLAVRSLLVTIRAAERLHCLQRTEEPIQPAAVAHDAGLPVNDYLHGLDILLPEPAPREGCSVGHTNGWLTATPGPHTSSETRLHIEIDWAALPAPRVDRPSSLTRRLIAAQTDAGNDLQMTGERVRGSR